jgi:hypothetical protein
VCTIHVSIWDGISAWVDAGCARGDSTITVPTDCVTTCAEGAESAETIRAGGLPSRLRDWGEQHPEAQQIAMIHGPSRIRTDRPPCSLTRILHTQVQTQRRSRIKSCRNILHARRRSAFPLPWAHVVNLEASVNRRETSSGGIGSVCSLGATCCADLAGIYFSTSREPCTYWQGRSEISESAVRKESGNATIATSGDQTGFSDRAGCTVSVKQLFDPFHQRR